MHPHDPDEESWLAFDVALRDADWPAPNPALRDRCLPGARGLGTRGARTETADRNLTVLVVDDEPNIRRLIEFHLTRAGYRVLLAADGLEALEQIANTRPDLMILDVTMPGPSGFRVLQTLKDDPRTAEIPVVMLTGRDGDDWVRQGSLSGADVYMTKPFHPEELRLVVDRLGAVLGTPDAPPPLRRWLK